jgi:NitT/TauT family transport system substrate-binding protein
MKKWMLVLIIAATAGLAGVALYHTYSAPRHDKVVIAQVADFFLYAPIYVAKDAGFFEKNGLDVQIVSTGGDEKAWAAVISGSAQFGVGDPTFVAIADQRGQPGRVVASIVNGVPFWGIAIRPEVAAINRPSELKPYVVATFPAPSTAYTLQAEMFRRGGLQPNIRQGGFGALIPMLVAKQADIALELEPNVSTAVVRQHAHVTYSLADIYGDFAITGLTATPQYLAANPDTSRRVLCSLRQALDYIHKEPQAALQILLKRFPEIDAQVAAAAFSRAESKHVIPQSTAISQAAWGKALQLRVQTGDVKTPKQMSSYVDNSYATYADQKCAMK